MGILCIYKPVGKTPLDIIKEIDEKKKSYAGRLDPMAHGLLLILTNEHCFKQDNFYNLNKIYKFELLIGFETDTLDILGLVKKQDKTIDLSISIINNIIDKLKGKRTQTYPTYSSVPVNKKPLWWWAKNNMLDNITIPTKEIEIYSLDLLYIEKIDYPNIKNIILKKLNSLGNRNNDFREKDIIKKWNSLGYNPYYNIITFRAHVSSGTYIRELCKQISMEMNTIGIALDIYRENIGDFNLK